MHRILFVVGLACLAVSTALAQDPVKVDPKHYKVEFENDHVRVLHINVGPHEKTPMHAHPASVLVWLTDGHVKFTFPPQPGGVKLDPEDAHGKAGQASWSAAVKHAGENLSDKPIELFQVELKAKPAVATPAAKKPPK